MTRLTIVLLAVCLSVPLAASTAEGSTSAAVTIDDPNPPLKPDGEGWKVTTGLTNITDEPVTVRVGATQPAASHTCRVLVGATPPTDTIKLAAATHVKAEVTYSAGCDVGNSGVVFNLVPDVQPPPANPITVAAASKPKPKIDWGILQWFGWGSIGALFLLASACVGLGLTPKIGPCTLLDRLPDTWKFSDSWASNITILGGVLTGVVGSSDTVKAILGEDADTALARATVSVAIAAALIGLGAIVLQIFKRDTSFTVIGLVVAGAIVVGAAFGELYIVWKTAEKLSLDGLERQLEVPFWIMAGLLAVYSVRNLRATIRAGVKVPDPAVPESAVVAAALVAALEGEHHTTKDLLEAVKAAFEMEQSVAGAPPPPAEAAARQKAAAAVVVRPRPLAAQQQAHAAML